MRSPPGSIMVQVAYVVGLQPTDFLFYKPRVAGMSLLLRCPDPRLECVTPLALFRWGD